jgi:ZIP family zinc transporter
MILPWALVCAAILGLGLPLGASISRPGRVAALVGRLIGPLAVGVLVFVLWDVLSEAFLPLDGALEQWIDGLAGPGPVTPLVVGFFVGLVAGFGVLAAAETWRARGCSVTVIGAGWAARGVIAGLVLGSASTSEDLALSVLAVIGLILAQGIHGADSGPQLPRRSVWRVGGRSRSSSRWPVSWSGRDFRTTRRPLARWRSAWGFGPPAPAR